MFELVSQNSNQMISSITRSRVDKKQVVAIVIPLILITTMYPVFRSLAGVLNDRIAWYIGLVIYWLVWGAVFPLLIIGKENIKALIRPHKPNKKVLLMVLFPLLMALIVRFMPGMGYEKESVLILVLLISTTFGNGFFEEVLWRGVYVKLFPDNIFFRMIWPGIWFGIWHYVPVSVLSDNVLGMMIGPALMGLYLSYLVKKTNTLWWAILVHFLGGIIMIA